MMQPEDKMDQSSGLKDKLDFVVGAELRLRDILSKADLALLFDACMKNGASGVAVIDRKDKLIYSSGAVPGAESITAGAEGLQLRELFFEGEPVGSICIAFSETEDLRQISAMTDIADACLHMIINTTAKRMLATELHTTVVHQSYEELLVTNRKLQASEKKYRELAENLEQKVVERTAELKSAHTRMLQQEKMASVGQLAAGMAHEINNPLGFILSNLNTFEGYMQRMKEMIQRYRTVLGDAAGADQKTAEMYQRLKIGFILEDAPELIRQSRDGAERVRRIVVNLKGFSHIDDAQDGYVNINEEIERTIQILEHESRDKAAFIRHYGELPKYFCNPGLICQVFLNIIQNAIHCSEEPVQIKITTRMEDGQIVVAIEDDGPGISPEIINRIFEPFFTTRDIGKGTGLGLSVAYDIVTNHGGRITAASVPGEGAAFTIRLPLRGSANGK